MLCLIDFPLSLAAKKRVKNFKDLKKFDCEAAHCIKSKFQHYFSELKEQEAILMQNLFSASLDASGISYEIQDQYFNLTNNSSALILYYEKSLFQLYIVYIYDSYPQTSKLVFQVLLPFATMYLCKSGFSAFLHMKTKERNRMYVEDDMRLIGFVLQTT